MCLFVCLFIDCNNSSKKLIHESNMWHDWPDRGVQTSMKLLIKSGDSVHMLLMRHQLFAYKWTEPLIVDRQCDIHWTQVLLNIFNALNGIVACDTHRQPTIWAISRRIIANIGTLVRAKSLI